MVYTKRFYVLNFGLISRLGMINFEELFSNERKLANKLLFVYYSVAKSAIIIDPIRFRTIFRVFGKNQHRTKNSYNIDNVSIVQY